MPTTQATFDVHDILNPDSLAMRISDMWFQWKLGKTRAEGLWQEVRDYIFATDTSTTANRTNGWMNSTTTPKLCQIRDNLHANYMSSLFPKRKWLTWEAAGAEGVDQEKRKTITSYIEDKVRLSGFRQTMGQLVYDYIDYGNCFAGVEHINERRLDEVGQEQRGYYGPKVYRISPADIVFNPRATSFRESPKIVRSVLTMGDMTRLVEDDPTNEYLSSILEEIKDIRSKIAELDPSEYDKLAAFQADGFDNYLQYLQSGSVEILDFYGDFYDADKGVLHRNCVISVVDRTKVIRNITNPNWMRHPHIYHVGWRERPDNLWAMGPLDNLVGMQYRIDHLENMRADAFDMMAYPMIKIKGEMHDFSYSPGEKLYVGEEGDVSFVHPDTTILQADFQIQTLERKMEELAGAPREAMGIRSPGEKTAFEVQKLDNASSRIFQNKIQHFEEVFEEEVLNGMLEIGRRQIDGIDTIRVFNEQINVEKFIDITPSDLTASGRLVPVAARHFAEKAEIIQNLNMIMNSAIGQDPGIRVHLSGKVLAKLTEEVLGLEQQKLFGDNIQVLENAETQRLAQAAQEQVQVESQTPAGGAIIEDDDGGEVEEIEEEEEERDL